MTTFWCVVWMGVLLVSCIAFHRNGYSNGKDDGFKEGYKKGRKEATDHIDSYLIARPLRKKEEIG